MFKDMKTNLLILIALVILLAVSCSLPYEAQSRDELKKHYAKDKMKIKIDSLYTSKYSKNIKWKYQSIKYDTLKNTIVVETKIKHEDYVDMEIELDTNLNIVRVINLLPPVY